jgi:hypothetical protein
VLVASDVLASAADGVLRPQPRWSMHEAVLLGVGRRPSPRRATAAWATVPGHFGLASRVVAELAMGALPVADVEHPRCEQLNQCGPRSHAQTLRAHRKDGDDKRPSVPAGVTT